MDGPGPGAVALSPWQLVLAAGLVLNAGGISLALRLGLEKRLVLASVRTVVQLLLVGVILRWVFRLEHVLPILGVILVMTVIAGRAAVQRSGRTFPGATWRAVVTLVLSAWLTAVLVTGAIIQIEPWYKPQYLVPLLGMILGNALTGISLCLDQILQTLADKRDQVEMELAHGATRWEAARAPLSDAVRRGMIPIINSMMVAGLVSLPGMMTGQILAGEDPLKAVEYQIVVMFMIAAATSLGCMLIAVLVYHRLFNARHQLLSDLITKRQN
ncbi:MAG TPA: iron export ABC transporter permease subunit FetB [Candidatus Hydrogenedentes bacterium]|nr:iron export ABC transporter permease subunit FetB [Candidatus Hydrogenedentota bacterium]